METVKSHLFDFDVIIIGSGIAGLSAARSLLTNYNCSIAIVEQKELGHANPSPLTFIDIVNEFDLSDCLKVSYSNFVFHNYEGSKICYLLEDKCLGVVNYKKACVKLLCNINKIGKVKIIRGQARAIEALEGISLVAFNDNYRISARLIIDASGSEQISIRSSSTKKKRQYYSHVYGAVFSKVGTHDHEVCAYLLPSDQLGSGGGWFYSLSDGRATFGYASISDSPYPDYSELKRIFIKAKETFEPYSKYLENSEIEYVEKGVIPISHSDNFVLGNVVLVGDAGGMATNWNCMGFEPALRYGDLLGRYCANFLRSGRREELYKFQEQWKQENTKSYTPLANDPLRFWNSDYYLWEWIIKNDLANLSSQRIIDRLRYNQHLMGKGIIFWRAMQFKIKSLVNKQLLSPQVIKIEK